MSLLTEGACVGEQCWCDLNILFSDNLTLYRNSPQIIGIIDVYLRCHLSKFQMSQKSLWQVLGYSQWMPETLSST